jgi:hypothetical protein
MQGQVLVAGKTMKLHILTDLHIEFGHFKPPVTDADLVILAGDTDLQTKGITWAKEAFAGKPVICVHILKSIVHIIF